MIKIPDLNLRVYKKALKDIEEYKELYQEQSGKDYLTDTPTDEHFISFRKSISGASDLARGYLRNLLSELCDFKYGDLVAVYDRSGKKICTTKFRNPYASIKDGCIYFNTDASAAKEYDPKECTVKLVREKAEV